MGTGVGAAFVEPNTADVAGRIRLELHTDFDRGVVVRAWLARGWSVRPDAGCWGCRKGPGHRRHEVAGEVLRVLERDVVGRRLRQCGARLEGDRPRAAVVRSG